MSKQNVYDNNVFFEKYRSSRGNEVNFNDCIETPILLAMLPDLHGKTILDIGCGMGQHAKQYSEMGAESVLGIDISENMLKGEVDYSEKQDGNETKIIIVPSLKKEKTSEFFGTIEIANYSGKIVLTRTEYTVQISTGENLTVPEIMTVQESGTSEEGIVTDYEQIQDLLSGALIRKLLSLPAEDLEFFNSDIPDEVWNALVQSLF